MERRLWHYEYTPGLKLDPEVAFALPLVDSAGAFHRMAIAVPLRGVRVVTGVLLKKAKQLGGVM